MVSVDGGFTPADLMVDVPVRYHRSEPAMKAAIWALAVASAIGAILAPGRPTGVWLVDAAWRAGFAMLIVLAASRGRRWPAVWMAGITTAFSGGFAIGLALGSFVLAAYGVFMPQRNRLLGAGAGLLAAQALLRLPDIGLHGMASIVAAVAVVPVFFSAYSCAHRTTRRVVRLGLLAGVMAVGVAVAGLAYAMKDAYPKLTDAVDATRDGHQALGAPDLGVAATKFQEGSDAFKAAASALDSPWAQPARVLPVLAQHRDVVLGASASGRQLTKSAANVASTAPYQELTSAGGQVDLARAEAMQEPVANSVDVLRDARAELDRERSPWLAQPVSRQLDRFADELDDAVPEAELASEALTLVPAILGSEQPRRYLVLFTSPAETRFLGGFAGAYGILNASAGKVTFDESGNIGDLNQAGDPSSRVLPQFEAREEYEARYARFFPQMFLQNLTVSPDLPTDAVVTRDLYQQATGQTIDGVIVADPYALAGFLTLTGPVAVEGVAEPMSADNVLDYLLLDQYVEFEGDNEARRDRLGDVADATFEALTSRDLPGPGRIGEALAPSVHEKHLMVWSFDETDQQLFDRLGAGGQFDPGGGDFFSLRTANGSANKIDSFLERSLNYDVEFDPGTGATKATARISLQNSSPTLLPDYVIGNSSGQPLGTNVMYLSFYSPLQLDGATRDGRPISTSAHRELGTNVYSMEVMIPSGTAVSIDLQLSGLLEPGASYDLLASSQPMINDDRVTVAIRSSAESWTTRSTGDLVGSGRAATWSGDLSRDHEWQAEFAPLP